MTDSSKDSLGFVIHDVARMMRWTFERRAQHLGLTRSQWSVLVQLVRHNGIQQKQLAALLDVTAITMSGLLDRLERDGWVDRRDDPDDRRAKRVFLTAKIETESILQNLRTIGEEVRETALAGLSAQERQQLMDLLLRLRGNLASKPIDENFKHKKDK